MHYQSILATIPVLLLQCTLAAPAAHGGDGSNGHGGWGSPEIQGGSSSDFNMGGGMGNGGFDNSHCNNNEGVAGITTTITTW